MRKLCLAACCSVLGCAPLEPPLSAPESAELRLLHLSDLHSHLFPTRERVAPADAFRGLGVAGELSTFGGVARLATLVRAARSGHAASLFVDSGDAVHGAPVYREAGGGPELVALSALGVDAHAVGNHDLDAGAAAAAARYRAFARFPALAANYVTDGALAGAVAPFARLTAGALRVAVVGVASETAGPDVLARDAAEAAQAAIDAARPLSDVIVLATHLGVDRDRALVERTTGADVVLGGHQHWVLDAPESVEDCGRELQAERGCTPRAVLVVHSGAYSKYLGVLDLELARALDPLDGLDVVAHAYRAEPASEAVPEDPELRELVAPYAPRAPELVGYAPRPIERFGVAGGDSALGNLVTETLRAELGVELALLNTSALRADLPAGAVSDAGLEAALPFDDAIVELWLDAAELEHAAGHAAARTRERRCQSSLQLAGARLRVACPAAAHALEDGAGRCLAGDCAARPAAALFGVAVTAYLAQGGSGFVRADRVLTGRRAAAPLLDALRARIRRGAPCGAGAGETEARRCDEAGDCAALSQPSECAGGRCAALGCRSEMLAALEASGARRSETELAGTAERLCATLPCLDARLGAARDGRVRIEAEP